MRAPTKAHGDMCTIRGCLAIPRSGHNHETVRQAQDVRTLPGKCRHVIHSEIKCFSLVQIVIVRDSIIVVFQRLVPVHNLRKRAMNII